MPRPPAPRPRAPGLAPRALPRAGALALVLILAACSDSAPVPEKPPVAVRVTTAERGPYSPTVTLTGTVAARTESDVSFRIPGRIAARLVDVGDRVKAGAVLARLDRTEQEADVTAARATLNAAEATLRQAETNFTRQDRLFARGYATGSVRDAARETLQRARGAYDAAKAALGTAEEQLAQTELLAEIDGVVTARYAEDGQVVNAAEAVFKLAEDNARDAVFDVFEKATSSEPVEGRVALALAEDPAVTAMGRVREVAPALDAANGTLRVKVAIEAPPPSMTLGAAVTGRATFAARDLVDLPASAFFVTAGAPSVWIVEETSNRVAARAVAIDRYLTGRILVSQGVADGDRVVTAGAQFLTEGQVVDPRPETDVAQAGR
ncbi:efflux RND transporter periplasmic adaptor subunit [Aurantimonas sp. Leaf443]|uniref:efflux RND transporter periplasmic adaptor subunit n=1 Tax=Aurantimonas sp. Leaf443 TaxID=1736378 RepID=UPI001FCD8FB9|nr:efflux RND transporter periplasmic adaptor subunit [Aurantimonas sp. Leaf443]